MFLLFQNPKIVINILYFRGALFNMLIIKFGSRSNIFDIAIRSENWRKKSIDFLLFKIETKKNGIKLKWM